MFALAQKMGGRALVAAGKAENLVVAVSCGLHSKRAAFTGLVGVLVTAVAALVLAVVPRRKTVRATVVGATDSHTLRDFPDATVTPRTESRIVRDAKGNTRQIRVTRYDVRLPGQANPLTCDARPSGSTFPVAVADGTVACPRPGWNTCAMKVAYKDKSYDVRKSGMHEACATLVAQGEDTFYYHPASDTLSASNMDAVIRGVVRGVRALGAYTTVASLVRLRYIPVYCNYDMKTELGGRCEAYATAWNKAFHLDKAEEVYETVEQASEMWGGSVGRVGTAAAQLAQFQNTVRMMWYSVLADYELYKCAVGGSSASWGAFVATTVGGMVVVFALVAYAARHVAARRIAPFVRGEGGAVWITTAASTLAAAVAGALAASWVPLALRGVRRQALGLDFFDRPRLWL